MKKRLLILLPVIALLAISFIAAEDCEISAKNTDDFLSEIPSLNDQLASCDAQVPSPMDKLFGDDLINVQVVRNDGSKDVFMITTEDGKVTSIETGYSEKPTYVATLAECALDAVLKSDNQAGALAYIYANKHLTIGPHGVWRSIVFRVVMFFARGRIASNAEQIDVSCPKGAVGDVCQDGGDCETGNCIYISGEGADRLYRCSCDAFKYDPYVDSDGKCINAVEYPESGKGKAGDLCQHGGQCESGNCIGIVPGQVYKCSCDAFKYVGGDSEGNCP